MCPHRPHTFQGCMAPGAIGQWLQWLRRHWKPLAPFGAIGAIGLAPLDWWRHWRHWTGAIGLLEPLSHSHQGIAGRKMFVADQPACLPSHGAQWLLEPLDWSHWQWLQSRTWRQAMAPRPRHCHSSPRHGSRFSPLRAGRQSCLHFPTIIASHSCHSDRKSVV